MPEYAVEFTSENQLVFCGGRSSCKKPMKPEDTHYLHNANSSLPGRKVCRECHQYYIGKTTSLRINDAEKLQLIQQQVSAAQRGKSSDIVVQPVGPAYRQIDNLNALTMHQGRPTTLPPGPIVITPAINNRIVLPAFPAEFRNPQAPNGYQEAHNRYVELKSHLSRQAYAMGAPEVFTARFVMKSLIPGRKTASCVEDIQETISSIPVHIGVSDLKAIGVTAVGYKWYKWTQGRMPLKESDVELRSLSWEEYLPRGEGGFDVDAVAHRFFKSVKGKAKKQFDGGSKVLDLVLALPNETYEVAQLHSNGEDAPDMSQPQLRRASKAQKNEKRGKETKGKNKATLPLFDLQSPASESGSLPSPASAFLQLPHPSHQPSKSVPAFAKSDRAPALLPKKDTPIFHVRDSENNGILKVDSKFELDSRTTGLDAKQLKCALLAQKVPGRKAMQKIFSHKVVECTIYPTEFLAISELVAKATAPILLKEKAFPATLTFSSENSVSGACKVAYFGETNKPVFDNSTSRKVCIKQAFHIDRTTAARVIYDSPTQYSTLSTEINCSRWASALMSLGYERMETEDAKRETKPPFVVPQMRYVNVVLAVANNPQHDTYMLEEVVDDNDGKFGKYINNTSASILPQKDEKRQYIGTFLSFMQHVQMVETQQQVFVSDLQGGRTLLSDPQIITSPSLGDANVRVFADGNLAAAFKYFGNDHICNEFCAYYKLPKIKPDRAGLEPKGLGLLKRARPSGNPPITVEDGEITEGGSSGRQLKKRKTQL